jgi:hypothetical protein
MPISQTGTKSINDAYDPVCLSTPLFSWSIGSLAATSFPPATVNFITCFAPNPTIVPVSYTSDGTILILRTQWALSLNAIRKPQDLDNYISGLVLTKIDSSGVVSQRNRIIDYKLLGIATDTTIFTPQYSYRIQLTVEGQVSYIDGDEFKITDSTDLTDPTEPLFFIPNGNVQPNSYSNYILYNEDNNDYVNVLSYDNITRLLTTEEIDPLTWSQLGNTNVSIRKEPPMYPPKLLLNGLAPKILRVSTPTTILFNPLDTSNSRFSLINDFYKNNFMRILGTKYVYKINAPQNETRRITSYTITNSANIGRSKLYTFTVNPPFSSNFDDGGFLSETVFTIEILRFSFDNFNPFVYNGSLVSQQELVCYEVELMDLVLPNGIITTGTGNKIAFYPFVYVEIANISDSNAGNRNILYSNNPNSVKMVFRVPIIDIQDPEVTPFVRVTGNGVVQSMKFKPNDNLLFSVRLPNGDIFDTEIPEYYSPSLPNFYAQVSALFRITRIN